MVNHWTRAARVVYNAAVDLRVGRPLTGATHSAGYSTKGTKNSDYLALDRILAGRVEYDDALVDVGCGKGRLIRYWRQRYDNPVVGIEPDPQIAARTRRRLRRHHDVTIITGNAVDCLPPEGTLYYLHDPFPADVVQQFADRLAAIAKSGAPILVLYSNCQHLAPFLDNPDWSVELLDPSPADPFDSVAVIEFVGGEI